VFSSVKWNLYIKMLKAQAKIGNNMSKLSGS